MMQGMRMARAMRIAPIVLRNIASWLKSMYFPPSSVMTSLPIVSRPVSLKYHNLQIFLDINFSSKRVNVLS